MKQLVLIAVAIPILLAGCGGDPELHTISGKVTLGGKTYDRIIVYFRPIAGKVNEFNLGVGETDAEGTLRLRSTAGPGIAPGKYRVSFSYVTVEGTDTGVAADEKADDKRTVVTTEMVPDEYASDENSPLEFEVKAGQDNVFEFDIPTK